MFSILNLPLCSTGKNKTKISFSKMSVNVSLKKLLRKLEHMSVLKCQPLAFNANVRLFNFISSFLHTHLILHLRFWSFYPICFANKTFLYCKFLLLMLKNFVPTVEIDVNFNNQVDQRIYSSVLIYFWNCSHGSYISHIVFLAT